MSCFNKSVNILLASLGSLASNILSQLFTQYCTSYYDIVLCDLTSSMFKQFCTLWRKNVRRILRVPQCTHNRLLHHIACIPKVDMSCTERVIRFYLSMLYSDVFLLKCMSKRCKYQSLSNMGKNVALLNRECSFMKYDCVSLMVECVRCSQKKNSIWYT